MAQVSERSLSEDLTKNSCALFLNNYVVNEFLKLREEAESLGRIFAECGQTKLLEVLSSMQINLLKISKLIQKKWALILIWQADI